MQSDFFDIWTGSTISNYRKNLLKGKDVTAHVPNAMQKALVLGKSHATAWRKIYKL